MAPLRARTRNTVMQRILEILVLAICTKTASAGAQAAQPSEEGLWSVEVGMIAVGVADNGGAELMNPGFQLGVGKHLTDTWYLGAGGDAELALKLAGDTALVEILRLGPELRHVIGEGRGGEVRINGGPSHHMPSRIWVGLRGCVEAIDGVHPTGGFGELEIASEYWLTPSFHSVLGLAAGVSIEPVDVYGGPKSSTIGVSPNALLELRFTFE